MCDLLGSILNYLTNLEFFWIPENLHQTKKHNGWLASWFPGLPAIKDDFPKQIPNEVRDSEIAETLLYYCNLLVPRFFISSFVW